jgi:hypothetical protein
MKSNKLIYFFLICQILFPVSSYAESPSALVNKGNSAYENKQYDEALKAYDAAGVDKPDSAEIYFNKGAVYYRQGEYDKAKQSWEKSALNTNDISLEARSLFNLGNTSFQQSERQKDSDPQKSIDACAQSIGYYQQALDLLKNQKNIDAPVLVKEASENIELVRLIMKATIDDMAKKKEQQQQQQQVAEDLKELIKKQQELHDRNQYFNQEKKDRGDSQELTENITKMAGDQKSLEEETKKAAEKLPSSDSNHPDLNDQAKSHLNQAQSEQQAATQKMMSGELDQAAPYQETALKELKEALESMEKDTGQGGKQEKQDQQGQKQNAQKEGDQQKEQTSEGQDQQQEQKQQQSDQQQEQNKDSDKWIGSKSDDAQGILDEEKENQKFRLQESPAGYRDVDKDW